MKKITLRLRITLLCGIILIGMAVVLTVVSVQNAENTYTKQFVMNIGDEFSITYGDNEISFGGGDGEQLNKIMDFAKLFIPSDVKENVLDGLFHSESQSESQSDKNQMGQLFKGAEKKFTVQSIVVATIFVIIGLFLIYIIVGKALKPIRNLSETVKNINENNLYEKIQKPVTIDEIGSLTTSFNQMLDRLSTSFTVQKTFAANAAHELRTPLTTIKAGIQVFEMDEEPTIEDCKETIEILNESNERLIKIVDNLLLISRESQEGFTEIISVEKLFHKIQNELMPMAETSEVMLIIKNFDGTLKGNQTLIYRAIYNLVENGIKYNIKGGKVVLNSTEQEKKVKITVSDNGLGIPSKSLAHIFEPFYRVDKSRSRSIGGSGLGLSIVKSIIERHNGTIYVDSVPGKGTVFTAEL